MTEIITKVKTTHCSRLKRDYARQSSLQWFSRQNSPIDAKLVYKCLTPGDSWQCKNCCQNK